MPILDLQKSFATTYRIRLGQQAPSKSSGKLRPIHLNGAIRITSPAQEAVEAFTDIYGGDVMGWDRDDGTQEWQAILPTSVLPIVILPGSTLIQWWEAWDSGGILRRCDGAQQVVEVGQAPKACQCPATPEARMKDQRACKPTTQILVVCPGVAVAGAGRLVSRGLIAAQQLPAALAVAEGFLERGLRVPAYLRVTHHAGRRDYVVPQLDLIGVGLPELDGGSSPAAAVGQGNAALPVGRPELVASPTPPAPVPTYDYGASAAPQAITEARASLASAPDSGRPFTEEDETLIPFEAQRDFARELSAWCREQYPGPGITKTTEAARHAVVRHVTGNPNRTSPRRCC